MAGSVRSNSSTSFLARRHKSPQPTLRVLTASASLLDLSNRRETKRIKNLRQSWQEQAWNYFDEIGEISYAHLFLANCASRMKIFPAAYPTGGYDEDPMPLAEIVGCPPEVVAAANDAMNALGTGRLSCASIMGSTSQNLSVAGEGFVLGMTDPGTGLDSFTIRSIDEIIITEDKYKLRELPTDTSGGTNGIDLDPDTTYLARIWTPHPRWRLFARSSMRSILDVCEEMQILNRVMRATGRSRMAQNGLLLVPDQISAEGQVEDNDDPQSDPFMGAFTEALTEGIADEGVASSVAPIVLRGPAPALAAIRHMTFDRVLDPVMAAQRQELIGRMASGLDLPKEVLMGMADLNHWTAWQVGADTFSQHVEPHIVNCVDALTVGYFRGSLMEDERLQGANAVWLSRLCVWYDPTELLTNPNRVQDATAAHAAMAISDASFREALGFGDEDRPLPSEIEERMIRNTRNWPPNMLMELAHILDPTLAFPPITAPGTVPGIGAEGVIAPPPPVAPVAQPPAIAAPPGIPETAPPAGGNEMPPTPAPEPILSSGKPKPTADQVRLSRKLVDIDRDVRRSLQVAASASVRRQLEKAGAKLRTQVHDAKDRSSMSAITGQPPESVASILGREKVETFASSASLVKSEWADVKQAWDSWVAAAQEQALTTAHQLAGSALSPTSVTAARSRFAQARSDGWDVLRPALDALAVSALYPPGVTASLPRGLAPAGSKLVIPPDLQITESGAADTDTAISVDPATLVPTSTIRDALSIAGGLDKALSRIDPATGTVPDGVTDPIPQIGTGSGISDLLAEADMATAGYQWIHGAPVREFEPHADLDGTEFSSFDDDALANPDSFPDVQYFIPGDHDGCTCDAMPLWAASDVGDRPVDQIDDSSAIEDASAIAEADALAASADPRSRHGTMTRKESR